MPINLGELVLDGSQAKEALAQLDGLLKLSGTDVQNLNKMFLESSSAAQNYKNLNAQLAQARAELKAATIGTQEFTAAAEKIAALTQQINPVRASLQGLNAETGNMGRSFLTSHRFMTSFTGSLGMMSMAVGNGASKLDMMAGRVSMGAMYFEMLSNRAEQAGTSIGTMLTGMLTTPSGLIEALTALYIVYNILNGVMGDSAEASKKDTAAMEDQKRAAQELKDALHDLSMEQLESQRRQLEQERTAAQAEKNKLKAERQAPEQPSDILLMQGFSRGGGILPETSREKELDKVLSDYDARLKDISDEENGRLKHWTGQVDQLKIQLADVQLRLEHENLTTAQRNKLLQEQAELQKQINAMTELPKDETKGGGRGTTRLGTSAVPDVANYREWFAKAMQDIGKSNAEAKKPMDDMYKQIEADNKRITEEDQKQRDLKLRGAEAEQRQSEDMIRSTQQLGDALVGAFARGNKGAAEVLKILNEMAAVAMLIYTLESTTNPASIISGIAGVISGLGHLFAGGGYTGTGPAAEPAGIVHRGEVVFEKPLVDKYGSQIMSIRRTMQQPTHYDEMLQTDRILATAHRIVSSAPSGGGASDARIVGAIGSLHSRLAGLEGSINKIADAISNMPAPVAQINNPVLLSDELEKEWPKQTAKYNNKFGNS